MIYAKGLAVIQMEMNTMKETLFLKNAKNVSLDQHHNIIQDVLGNVRVAV